MSGFTQLRTGERPQRSAERQPERVLTRHTALDEHELDPIAKQLLQDMGPANHLLRRPEPVITPQPDAPELSVRRPHPLLAGGLFVVGAVAVAVGLSRTGGAPVAAATVPTEVFDDYI